MEYILELIDKYLAIGESYFTIGFLFRSLEEEVDPNSLSLYEYFNNFSSVDSEKIALDLKNSNIPYDKANRIVDALNVLKEVFTKYKVNSLDELSTFILNCWENHKKYNEELIRKVLLIGDSSPKLLKIYIDMVNNNMIEDPNMIIGTSSERLYTMLPEDESCYYSNLKVISDSKVDWTFYCNGSNPFGRYCFLYNKSKSEKERQYYHDLIIAAIKGSCSLFNNKFRLHPYSEPTEKPINYGFISAANISENHSIKDIDFINELYQLLLTDSLFEHQMNLYTEKNEDADKVVKVLKELREKDNNIKR